MCKVSQEQREKIEDLRARILASTDTEARKQALLNQLSMLRPEQCDCPECSAKEAAFQDHLEVEDPALQAVHRNMHWWPRNVMSKRAMPYLALGVGMTLLVLILSSITRTK